MARLLSILQGGKLSTSSQPNPTSQSWFCLAINDNSEITHEAKKAAPGGRSLFVDWLTPMPPPPGFSVGDLGFGD